jgi:hypothetical protein
MDKRGVLMDVAEVVPRHNAFGRDGDAEGVAPGTPAAPTWLEGAHRYRARRRTVAHHDGACDSMYPGTWLDRDGRCVLPEGHDGAHLYRREAEQVLTREQEYQAVRAQTIRDRLKRERVARIEHAAVNR